MIDSIITLTVICNNRKFFKLITNELSTVFLRILTIFQALHIKTHDSESRGQEEAQQCDH